MLGEIDEGEPALAAGKLPLFDQRRAVLDRDAAGQVDAGVAKVLPIPAQDPANCR